MHTDNNIIDISSLSAEKAAQSGAGEFEGSKPHLGGCHSEGVSAAGVAESLPVYQYQRRVCREYRTARQKPQQSPVCLL